MLARGGMQLQREEEPGHLIQRMRARVLQDGGPQLQSKEVHRQQMPPCEYTLGDLDGMMQSVAVLLSLRLGAVALQPKMTAAAETSLRAP